MTRLLDLAGLVLAMIVSAFLFLAMAGGVAGASHECDQWAQQATGVEWVCQDGVR